MKLCVRKSDNEIMNDIHTGHPRTVDMTREAARAWGGESSNYWCIPILDREVFSRLMSKDEMDIYDFIKSDYLRKYLTILMDFMYGDIDPCWLEDLEFADGTNHLYKLFARRTLKKIKQITSLANLVVFHAKGRRIGEDLRLKIIPSDEHAAILKIEEEGEIDLNSHLSSMDADYLAAHNGKKNWLSGKDLVSMIGGGNDRNPTAMVGVPKNHLG